MQSPGSKHIKMLLVQMLHFRKVKPQQFRLLDFSVSHHVRHLESGYLIWKGKMLAQLVTCGRVRWGGPGWCVCSPSKGHGAQWCCRGAERSCGTVLLPGLPVVLEEECRAEAVGQISPLDMELSGPRWFGVRFRGNSSLQYSWCLLSHELFNSQ